MQKPKLQPRTGADQDAALFATSCVLLARWLNVAEARRLVRDDVTRAAVARAEAEVASATDDFLAIPLPDPDPASA